MIVNIDVYSRLTRGRGINNIFLIVNGVIKDYDITGFNTSYFHSLLFIG